MKPASLLSICCVVLLHMASYAQQKEPDKSNKDSLTPAHNLVKDSVRHKDSVVKKKSDPRRATLYSAILPGAGQIYNKKYWKLPIVYAAVGIPAYTYFYNKDWYKKCQYALAVAVSGNTGDSLNAVAPELKGLAASGDQNSIINYRNEFRRNQDYSVLFFLLFWGLNIVDATVDAHLKDFDVSSDLSMQIKPVFIPGPNYVAGVSFIFDLHKSRSKLINLGN